KWAIESSGPGYGYAYRPRRYATAYRPNYFHRVEPRRRYDGHRHDVYRDVYRYDTGRYDTGRYDVTPAYDDEESRYFRPRADYREPWSRPGYERDYVVRDVVRSDGAAYETEEPTVGVSLPVSLI
ncbi:MAG: hypothetical protein AAGG46_12855, partial [Planctomycetota bacterium]